MLKIALGQMEIIAGHPRSNAEKMFAMIAEAKKEHAHLIIFPEMSISGRLLGDTWTKQAFLRECEDFGQYIVKASENIAIIFGNVAVDWDKRGIDGRVRKYNACFVAHNCSLSFPEGATYPFFIKNQPLPYRDFDNTHQFYSLHQVAAELGKDINCLSMPVRLNLNGHDVKIACFIGESREDSLYAAACPQNTKAAEEADLLVNISSSPFSINKGNNQNQPLLLQNQGSKQSLIYLNNVGLQNNGKNIYAFDGCSSVYDYKGNLIHHLTPFKEELAVIDLPLSTGRTPEKQDISGQNNIAQIFRAIDYTIPKFLSAIKQTRVVIGVSGGIDSAVNAALYKRAVGAENLLLVNMPSKFNSSATKNAAYQLAANLGCLYTVMPIDGSLERTVAQISQTPITSLEKKTEFNLTLTPFMQENIQARDRSTRLLAGIAAAFGAVFTCNANKSELTVGYSTLYGDQAGFFAVTADLWKYQVYELAEYLNKSVYGQDVIPTSSLNLIPSAELSFSQNAEKGQGDPFIYPYHDYLFRAFIENFNPATPEEILSWYHEGILEEKIGCDKGLVNKIFQSGKEFIADLERWWTLYTGLSVAKRLQAPPLLVLSPHAYGCEYFESQNGVYYTQNYLRLKEKIIVDVI